MYLSFVKFAFLLVKTSCNTMRDPKEPCFKPSLLGSPFYPGRTMYGGASASYINSPNIKQRKNTLVNESSSADNTVSHSTRRIMDLLEHYSSPLNEAKRIPQYVRAPKNDSSISSFDSSSPNNSKVICKYCNFIFNQNKINVFVCNVPRQ